MKINQIRGLNFVNGLPGNRDENESSPGLIVWSDEAPIINRHNCVYWTKENLHMKQLSSSDLLSICQNNH
jgi:hypothetical protein